MVISICMVTGGRTGVKRAGIESGVYVLKTLSTDRESYLAIGMLTNLICYYANKVISEHMGHFD